MSYRQPLCKSREEYERTKPKPANAIVQEGDDTLDCRRSNTFIALPDKPSTSRANIHGCTRALQPTRSH